MTPAARGAFFLILHQARYDLLGILRNRQARFFTLVLPLLFLIIFVGVFGDHVVGPGSMKASAYYVPGLAALGIIAASFVNLVISITAQREGGILKRRRATPVPAWVLVAGRASGRWEVPGWTSTMILLMVASGVDLPSWSMTIWRAVSLPPGAVTDTSTGVETPTR